MKFTSSHFDKRKKADALILPFWQGAEQAVLAIKEKFHGHFELDSHAYNLAKGPFVKRVLSMNI